MVKDIWQSSISATAVGTGVGAGIAKAVEAMKARIIEANCILGRQVVEPRVIPEQ
jgi:hypothetical protein